MKEANTVLQEVDSILSKIADHNQLVEWWRLLSIGILPDDLPERFRDQSYEPYLVMWLSRHLTWSEMESSIPDCDLSKMLTRRIDRFEDDEESRMI